VVEAVTVVEGSLAYCGVLHVLRCSSGRLFWLPWLQSGSHDHRIIHVAHAFTCLYKSWSLNTHKYTHTVNFNCIQICVAFPYGIECRCTVQSCRSCCVVCKQASIRSSVRKCTQRRDSNTAEIHCIHNCAATRRVEG